MYLDDLWMPLNDENLKWIRDCEYYLVAWDNDCDPDFRIDCPIIAQARYMHFPEYTRRNGEISPEGWRWVFECFPIRSNQVWEQVYGEKEFLIKRFIPLGTKVEEV